MPQTVRLFIAVTIKPPPPLRKVLSRLDMMGRAVKPVSADNLHLTLKFLGDVEAILTPQITDAVQTAVGDLAAFEMPLVGLGAFPHARRPSIIWVGTAGARALVEIADSLERLLRPLGFEPERRKFHPHVTLARIRSKPPDELATMLEAKQSTDFGTVPVTAVQLFQSELHADGPRYTVLSTVELAST
jgi:2'-5' RNA ligase